MRKQAANQGLDFLRTTPVRLLGLRHHRWLARTLDWRSGDRRALPRIPIVPDCEVATAAPEMQWR